MAPPAMRPYAAEHDLDAVDRIWQEIGWLEPGHAETLAHFLSEARAVVTDVDGSPEVCVTTHPGTFRHGCTDLPLCAVTSVTVSRIARQGGLAAASTAEAVAHGAATGAVVAALGIFDQGYYDRFGFGTGGYAHRWRIDPQQLTVPIPSRRPVRLSTDDWAEVHGCRLGGRRSHGGLTITPPSFTRAESGWDGPKSFGLGFRDADGALTHHVWFVAGDDVETGPYRVDWWSHRSVEDLRDLLGVIRSLGDQVVQFDLPEPPGVQVQALLRRPRRAQLVGSTLGAPGGRTSSWWQARILDLPAAIAVLDAPGPATRFVLDLDDPIADHLPRGHPWTGAAGAWIVEAGRSSGAVRGDDARLPRLRCGVGTFTRWWMGAAPAIGLAVTDDIDAPESLLEQLDALALPRDPRPDWPF